MSPSAAYEPSLDEMPRIHVTPLFDGSPHIAMPECWCEPELSYEDPLTGGEVWVHHVAH